MTIVELEKVLKGRLEPAADTQAGVERMVQASIAVSLKRIADSLEKPQVTGSALSPNPVFVGGFGVARTTAALPNEEPGARS